MLKPDLEILSAYNVAPCFEIATTETVKCHSYATLWKMGKAPKPDMIKADVQGAEYDVLSGFGPLLRDCLGVEIESHLYPIYKGQKLLSEIVAMLGREGLYLRRLQPQMTFDGELVEVNAFFTRRKSADLGIEQMNKLDLIEQMWSLKCNVGGSHMANKYG